MSESKCVIGSGTRWHVYLAAPVSFSCTKEERGKAGRPYHNPFGCGRCATSERIPISAFQQRSGSSFQKLWKSRAWPQHSVDDFQTPSCSVRILGSGSLHPRVSVYHGAGTSQPAVVVHTKAT